ncbi:tetratricopeptide repeat protein [Sphingomonas lutea]|uniref:Tetratricopeptide repeat protein n=1 Tax=Sphingomonas lutea TaxID=1045317 RepID=A0A7G9SFJ2_9SPHN|nr:tetratricopeptide repeat protein [Sphingomonas lutea]QNN66617.1 tetratricopeptide repeat protein [Sphingomonas lutea]
MAIAASAPQAAQARLTTDSSGPMTYVKARAAALSGDHARSATLLADLSASRPDDADLARKALTEALGAGQMDVALKLAHSVPGARLTNEARLLLVAEEVKRKRYDQARAWLAYKGETGDLSFLTPLIDAWALAEAGQTDLALQAVEQIPQNSLLGPLKPEQAALINLKARRTADAEPFARRAIGAAGARETRLRLALADGFLAAGDKARALIMLDGMGAEGPVARRRIESGRQSGQAIDTLAKALGESLTAFAADLARMQRGAPPIGLVQVARYADPTNSSTMLLLALLLDSDERTAEALSLLRSIPPKDALIAHARDVQARTFADEKRFDEAYALAASAARAPDAGVSDYSRLGEVYQAMDRHNEAADAYGRAVAIAARLGLKNEQWTLHLLRASALEDANRWPEARQALHAGLAIAPEQPLLLNFLGYGQLERGEDLDNAEAMIRKASALAPEDASITDSLGWAQFKRGKLAEAIATLQRAAEKDPDQAEIHEHLGDALYTSGRKFEARFAWSAALVTAEETMAKRIQAKLDGGLTPANAAP